MKSCLAYSMTYSGQFTARAQSRESQPAYKLWSYAANILLWFSCSKYAGSTQLETSATAERHPTCTGAGRQRRSGPLLNRASRRSHRTISYRQPRAVKFKLENRRSILSRSGTLVRSAVRLHITAAGRSSLSPTRDVWSHPLAAGWKSRCRRQIYTGWPKKK